MKMKPMPLIILAVELSRCLIYADRPTNNSTNPIVKMGDYSMKRGTNGHWIFVNPSEFWNGIWKEDTNGWRVQLRIYSQANYKYEGNRGYPISTNLMLRIEWGSAEKNSGDGYYMSPNGKFAVFELLDAKGNIVPPNPDAGTNLCEITLHGYDGGLKLTYETNLPAWVAPLSGSLVAEFPKTILTDVYPYVEYNMASGKIGHDIMGRTGSVTNRPPFYVGLLKLDKIYSVTNEGNYTLTVQPVLYKLRAGTNLLDRVDLPEVSTKVHLVPNASSGN
jgi:hypothetical protein